MYETVQNPEDGATTPETEPTVFKVGDNSVYNSVDSLHKGAIAKEEHISTLTSENAELKSKLAELENTSNVAEELKAMKELLSKSESAEENTTSPQLDEETIRKLAADIYTSKQTEEISKRNAQEATEALNKAFGKDAKVVFENKAKELGMSQEELHSMAAKSPSAFKTLLGINNNANATSKELLGKSSTLSTFHRPEEDNTPEWKKKLNERKSREVVSSKEVLAMYKLAST